MVACGIWFSETSVHSPFPACSREQAYTFVSYAHADAETVYPDLVALRSAAVEIWYDEGIEPGSAWREELGSAIEQCATFLFFLSSSSVASKHCQQELDFALELERKIVIVHLEPVELTPGLRLSLNNRQALVRYATPEAEYLRKLSTALAQTGDQTPVAPTTNKPIPKAGIWNKGWWAVAAALCLIVISGIWITNRTPATPTITDLSEITSLAVLPFTTAGMDEKDTYLGVSIAEELMNALYKLDDLNLANRNDTFRIAANDSAMSEKAQSLRVQALLSGALQEQQGRTRVSLTLTYVDGFELWNERVEVEAGDPFVLQRRIVETVSQALRANSPTGPVNDGPDFGTENPEAYRLGTLGGQLARQVGDVNAVTKASELIEKALAIDPTYHELYPKLLTAKATARMHNNTMDMFSSEIDAVVERAQLAGAPREIELNLSIMRAELQSDLFSVERLMREQLSLHSGKEWDPLSGFSGPVYNYGLLLAVAGYFDDAGTYWRSLLPSAGSIEQQNFLQAKLLELELAAGNFETVIDALDSCGNDAARSLAPPGRCLARLMRAQLGMGSNDAALETARLHPDPNTRGYMIALVERDKQTLANALQNVPPEIWIVHYRFLLDNNRSDQAFEFWRNRFPHGGRHFLWDTIFMETAEHPHLWQDEGFIGLLYFYGMTPAWRNNICEGARKAAEFTEIVPSCKHGIPDAVKRKDNVL